MQSVYSRLADRLNRFPQGAPPTKTLYKILKLLFSAKEADYVSLLPIKPFTVKTAAAVWKMSEAEARKILDTLAGKAILLDIDNNGESVYVLPPPMAGFFEFSMMRIRQDIDQKLLAELFYRYLNEEDDFILDLFGKGETKLGRVFVQESALPPEHSLEVLDYEKASEVIRTSPFIGVGICYCRHKMQHMGRNCDAPLDICMTFNNSAASLIKHGIIRQISATECLDLLKKAYELNLVQFGDNVRQHVNFICNCCGCCCEAMIAARKIGFSAPVHTTNFLPEINNQTCNGCGKCVSACPIEALGLVAANDPHDHRRRKAHIDDNICLGCGVCVRNCPKNSIRLRPRTRRVITPLNSTHRAVVMAIERGKLAELIFDNKALWNHRLMAVILGVILRLGPVHRALASSQVKSRYLEKLITRMKL
jgi:formate hydrogenlyase subunit 6/NADH:ubiquinone oxidoreductase subunit I